MIAEFITKEDLKLFKKELIDDLIVALRNDQTKVSEWLKSSEVRKMFNISANTLQSLRIKGTLKYSKLEERISTIRMMSTICSKEGFQSDLQRQFFVAFFERIEHDNRISPSHLLLFIAIYYYHQQDGKGNCVKITRKRLMETAKIKSTSTYHKCIKELDDSIISATNHLSTRVA